MNVLITLNPGLGANIGPNLFLTNDSGSYSQVVTVAQLLNGLSTNIPDETLLIYVDSIGVCTNRLTLSVYGTTITPTITPTNSPTTITPTDAPTASPTSAPTTIVPTITPTDSPTVSPTTVAPTDSPTLSPTTIPPTLSPECSNQTSEGFDNPDTLIGSKVLSNGITLSTGYTGPSVTAPGPRGAGNFLCGGSYFFHSDAAYLGQYSGAFTFTLNFDSPVTDLLILTISMGYNTHPSDQECLTINTNAEVPSLTVLDGCGGMSASGNVLCGAWSSGNTGGTTKISTVSPFTQLIISGTPDGTLAGIGVNICFPCPAAPI